MSVAFPEFFEVRLLKSMVEVDQRSCRRLEI